MRFTGGCLVNPRILFLTFGIACAGCGLMSPPTALDNDARAFMDLVRRDRLESALASLRVAIHPDTAINLLRQARSFLNTFDADSLKLIGWNVVYSADTTGTLTYEAHHNARTGLVSVTVVRAARGSEIRALHWQATAQPLATANAFTFRGKTTRHYLFLLAAVGAVVACVGGAIFAGTHRMGIAWILVCLIGVGSASINWTTGGMRFSPLTFRLFGAGYVRSAEVAPWIVTWSIPVGTILMMLVWRRRRKRAHLKVEESPVPSSEVS